MNTLLLGISQTLRHFRWTLIRRWTTPVEVASEMRGDGLLMITFSGTYPDGSAGNSVAEGMVTTAGDLIRQHQPAGVVVDLRNLRYHWGDMVEWIYGIGGNAHPPIPQATVVSRKNRRALSKLEFGPGTRKDITALDDVFDSVEEAVAFVGRQKR